jgi:hypothetical protein
MVNRRNDKSVSLWLKGPGGYCRLAASDPVYFFGAPGAPGLP